MFYLSALTATTGLGREGWLCHNQHTKKNAFNGLARETTYIPVTRNQERTGRQKPALISSFLCSGPLSTPYILLCPREADPQGLHQWVSCPQVSNSVSGKYQQLIRKEVESKPRYLLPRIPPCLLTEGDGLSLQKTTAPVGSPFSRAQVCGSGSHSVLSLHQVQAGNSFLPLLTLVMQSTLTHPNICKKHLH